MENRPGEEWKHTTAKNLYEINEENQRIEIFDDELPNQLTLYYNDGNGLRWPIRSINKENPEHCQSVLEAWSLKAEWIDSRQDKSIPLPGLETAKS